MTNLKISNKNLEENYKKLKALVLNDENYEQCQNKEATTTLIDFIEKAVKRPQHRIIMLDVFLGKKGVLLNFLPFAYLEPEPIHEIDKVHAVMQGMARMLPFDESTAFYDELG